MDPGSYDRQSLGTYYFSSKNKTLPTYLPTYLSIYRQWKNVNLICIILGIFQHTLVTIQGPDSRAKLGESSTTASFPIQASLQHHG